MEDGFRADVYVMMIVRLECSVKKIVLIIWVYIQLDNPDQTNPNYKVWLSLISISGRRVGFIFLNPN